MPTRRTVLAGIGTAGIAAFGVGAAGAATDGDGSGDGGDPQAALRVAHASPDAPAVDVAVDGSEAVSGLSFRRVSKYLTLAPGDHTVRVTAADDDSEVFYEETLTLEAEAYTAVASGEATVESPTFGVDVLTDTPVDLGSDEARIRAVHASPDAGAVDVTLDDASVVAFDDLTAGDVVSTTVAAGDYEVELRPDGDDDDAYGDDLPRLERPLAPAGGESYTLVVVGYVTPENEAAPEGLGVVAVTDRTTAPTTGGDEEEQEDEEQEDEEDEEEREDEEDEEEREDEDQRGPGDEEGDGDEYGPGSESGAGDERGPGDEDGEGDEYGPGDEDGPGDEYGPGENHGGGEGHGPS